MNRHAYLITICELYAAEFDIKFNGAKSKYMVFKGRNCDVFNIDIYYVNCNVVAKVTSADHLGHRISSVNNTSMIQATEAQFWNSFNLFLANLVTVTQLSIFFLIVLLLWIATLEFKWQGLF